MADKKWRNRKLGNRELAPETLVMGFGYDPMLSEGSLKPPQFLTPPRQLFQGNKPTND